MNFHTLSSSGLDEKLKCFVCKNYLCYFPISICSNNLSLCGRCPLPEGLLSFQNEAFETISHSMKFPCRYKSEGCYEELFPKDVPQHEIKCKFRIVSCILTESDQCKWDGSLPILPEHCRSDHADKFLQNGQFELDLSQTEPCDNIIEHQNALLIFSRKFSENGILQCAIYHNEYEMNPENYECKLNIKNDNKTLSLELNVTKFEDRTFNDLSLQSVTIQENGKGVSANIQIGNTEVSSKILQQEVLPVLRCKVCLNFTLPPFRQCMEDLRIICSDCRSKHLKSCLRCEKAPEVSSLYSPMLGIARLVDYPCKHISRGCGHVSKYQNMRTHRRYCPYRPVHCPLKDFVSCSTVCQKLELNDHLLHSHKTFMLDSSENFQQFSIIMNDTKCYIIKFGNYFFMCSCLEEIERYVWSVQKIDDCADKFQYEIYVINRSKSRELIMRNECARLTERKKIFSRSSACWYLKKDQICDFPVPGEKDMIHFKIRILKI